MASAMSTRQVAGLKQSNAFTSRVASRVSAVRPCAPRATRQVTRALSDVNLVVGGATVACLALGRFVFLPYQRRTNSAAGLPVQNGMTHFEAGDKRAQEASFVLSTNDPAGFTIVDTFAWGAIGHAFAYSILASQSVLNTL